MDRRAFLGTVAGSLLAAEAQQAEKVYRVDLLGEKASDPSEGRLSQVFRSESSWFDPGTPQSSRFDPFFQGPRDMGYVDGQTITIDYLSAGTS